MNHQQSLEKNSLHSKFSKICLLLVFILLVGIGLWVRFFPLYGLASDDAREKASVYVATQVREHVNKQIKKRHPQASPEERKVLEKKLFDQTLKDQRSIVKEKIAAFSNEIDKESGRRYSYLQASDSFYYFDLTKRILKYGHLNYKRQGSKYFNEKMLAPIGHWEPYNLQPYIGAITHRIASVFTRDIDVMTSVSIVPIVLFVLTMIIFIWSLNPLKLHPLAILLSGVLLICAPVYVKRSLWGWFDNDPYNILFPLLVYGSFIRIWLAQTSGQKLLWSLSTTLSLVLYAFFWQGWVFLYACLFCSGVATTLCSVIKINPLSIKENFKWFSIILFSSCFGIMLLFGATQFLDLFNEAIVAFREFSQPQLDLWPNIYITVGELKRLHLSEIIHLIGGLQVLFWSLLSIIYHGYNLITQSPWLKTKVNKPKDNTALETQKSTMIDTTFTASSKADCYPFNILFTLIICATASLLITMSALRFTLLTLPPLVLLAAISIDSCVKVCINFKMMNNRFIIYLLSVFVYSIFLAWPITMINKEIKADFLSDIYNDTWHAALTKTKAMTPEDSIVTSWWPPGHFIKSIADRSVTFDGASINYPQAYWLSRFLLASDENFALGILRMLNNSGNKTVELLSAKTNWPLSKVIDVILTITGQSSFSALQTLEQFISDTNLIMNVLALTHSQPRPSYFLLYNDMVENQIQFPFFGNWPFKRIEEINADPKKLKLVPSPSNKKAHVKFLWDLAGGTTAHTGPYQRISQQEDIIKFAEGIYFNPKDKSVVVDSEKHGKGRPFSVIFQENDSVIEYKQNNPNLNYSVIITQDHTDSYAFITSQQMARSLLMRLFYFKDTGLKHIKHLFTEIDLTRRTQIQLYEINWLSFFDELNNKTPAAQKNN